MKIAILADTHFGARNDSPQFNAFFKTFYKEHFFPYIDAHQIDTVIHAGDVFDRRKYVNFHTLHSCQQYFFDPLRHRDITMYVIPGNHDTYFKNTNQINSLQLLLRGYDNIQILEEPVRRQFGTRTASFIPWMCAENEADILQYIESDTADLCIGHFELSGFDMYAGTPNLDGRTADFLRHYDRVVTGHFHHRSTVGNVHYLGSPYEFTWSDFDDPRGFHMWDTETNELTFIRNPKQMFHKLYYDDRKTMLWDPSRYHKTCVKLFVVHKENYLTFDEFVQGLYDHEVVELSIHDNLADFEDAQHSVDTDNVDDTLSLLSFFIDATDNQLIDKERLKAVMHTLYIEAHSSSD